MARTFQEGHILLDRIIAAPGLTSCRLLLNTGTTRPLVL